MGIDIDNQGLYLNDAIKKILEEMDTLIVNNEILHKEEINLDEALGKVSMEEILSEEDMPCLLYTSPSPRDVEESRMPSSA